MMRNRAAARLLLLLLVMLTFFCACGRRELEVAKEGDIYVHFLDVGQADCTLIRTEDTVILVDTGDTEPATVQKIVSYLRSLDIEKVDCLVLTHPHADHIGGAATLLAEFSVRECVLPNCAEDTDLFLSLLSALESEKCAVHEAVRGASYTYGEVLLEFLSPDEYGADQPNEASAVFRAVYRRNTILFMSDTTMETEEELLRYYGADRLGAQILKLGHHGAKTSTGEKFLDVVSPKHAVASCGTGNSYGYPHVDLVLRVLEAGVTLHRTDTDGNVVFYGNGEEFTLLN